MALVNVELGERSYTIHIQEGALDGVGTILSDSLTKKIVIVTNQSIAPLYLQKLKASLCQYKVTDIIIPDGETYKTLAQYEKIMTDLLAMHAARDTTLVALGGGVVGDLCGFVAATYQRGIPFIQIPTTLLAQVDSSVGGKTAVNHPLGKNMIGAFYQPQAVLIDTQSLQTLPSQEFSAGMAEVIKYGVIYDADFFAWLEDNKAAIKSGHTDTLVYMIQRCCEIKAEIVSLDEREGGIRALLNLGHTFGHAIEAELGFGTWLHGEAVAAGIIIACDVATREFEFPASDFCRVQNLLKYFDLPLFGPDSMGYETYMQHMRLDKKVADNKIRFVIPTRIGHAVVTADIADASLKAVLQ